MYSIMLNILLYTDCVDFLSTGLETLGVKKFDKEPPGGDMDRISSDTFLKEA